eukprot:TRINITY_DN17243_c0_g1_i1.p1 TRINITY_DN17243_c0_g1~~TRINITY_DN17243_c0_g1_i1.p1  ORF type:complete len:244 (+),score=57.41 TRINITY_DN17243_c0_g1_i1:159-890(+)
MATFAQLSAAVAADNQAGQGQFHDFLFGGKTPELLSSADAAAASSAAAGHLEGSASGSTDTHDAAAVAAAGDSEGAHHGMEGGAAEHAESLGLVAGAVQGLKVAKTGLLVAGGMCNKLFGLGMMGFLVFQSMKTSIPSQKEPPPAKPTPQLVASPLRKQKGKEEKRKKKKKEVDQVWVLHTGVCSVVSSCARLIEAREHDKDFAVGEPAARPRLLQLRLQDGNVCPAVSSCRGGQPSWARTVP